MRKGSDIRRVLDRRLEMCSRDEFDPLVDEAIRCDWPIRVRVPQVMDDHFVSVFSRLMLCGKVRALFVGYLIIIKELSLLPQT